jgi:hypothetical protein
VGGGMASAGDVLPDWREHEGAVGENVHGEGEPW